MNGFPKTVRAADVPYTVILRSGADLYDEEAVEIARLIYACGAVKGTVGQIENRVRRAHLLIIARWADKIAGVAALKSPELTYRRRLRENVGVDVPENEYPSELGYVAVSEANRGRRLSSLLMAELISLPLGADGVFATTKREGYRTAALPNLGFKYRGSYLNDEGETVYLLTKARS
ncbi:hypothetical protein MR829_14740 [Paracoccus versutus]|uniref:hypothetical protein n=1 Tax=Paracoccus versutus TaxID=34007 RepID=UPI001FB85B0C|nr:hypothetical protein [Paracoccus versutus]MCJ1901627.1 hypothetical protein [Paracoccus versutus]